jgi:hypothetical protein
VFELLMPQLRFGCGSGPFPIVFQRISSSSGSSRWWWAWKELIRNHWIRILLPSSRTFLLLLLFLEGANQTIPIAPWNDQEGYKMTLLMIQAIAGIAVHQRIVTVIQGHWQIGVRHGKVIIVFRGLISIIIGSSIGITIFGTCLGSGFVWSESSVEAAVIDWDFFLLVVVVVVVVFVSILFVFAAIAFFWVVFSCRRMMPME